MYCYKLALKCNTFTVKSLCLYTLRCNYMHMFCHINTTVLEKMLKESIIKYYQWLLN